MLEACVWLVAIWYTLWRILYWLGITKWDPAGPRVGSRRAAWLAATAKSQSSAVNSSEEGASASSRISER